MWRRPALLANHIGHVHAPAVVRHHTSPLVVMPPVIIFIILFVNDVITISIIYYQLSPIVQLQSLLLPGVIEHAGVRPPSGHHLDQSEVSIVAS